MIMQSKRLLKPQLSCLEVFRLILAFLEHVRVFVALETYFFAVFARLGLSMSHPLHSQKETENLGANVFIEAPRFVVLKPLE